MTGKRLLIALAWVALAMALTIGLLWVFQRSLIYLPSQRVPDPPPGVEEVTYETEDGLTLTAWFIGAEEERGAVIVFNGNAGNRANRLPLGSALAERGFSVLLTDYRGYGDNPGSPTEQGLALDARAALDYMRERVDTNRISFFGESLGGGVAIGLATEYRPATLILRSPFTSLAGVASVHYWWLPSSLLLKDRYPNLDRIGEIGVPVMVIAGSDDRIVPTDLSREVYEAASDPKELLIVDGAGHNDLALLDGEEMIEGVERFLTEPR